MSYETDRKRIAYGFAAVTILIVGYLTVVNPGALNPVVVGVISLFLVSTLALLGVENPIQQRKGESREGFLERLAGNGKEDERGSRPGRADEGEAHPRNDRRGLPVLWTHLRPVRLHLGEQPSERLA